MGDDNRFAMLPVAALRDRSLTYRTLTVLGAICSFRQDSGDVLIEGAGRNDIAGRCGLHPSVISSATTELEKLGWLEKVGRGGRKVKTVYRLTIPETIVQPETVTDSATVSQSETVTRSETVSEFVSKTVSTSATPLYKKEVNTDRGVSEPSAESIGFAEFWRQYPKRVAKPDALKAWRKLKPSGHLLADLMAGLAKQKASNDWQKESGQFVPYPATWLNGRRWEDEVPPAAEKTAEPVRNPVFEGAV